MASSVMLSNSELVARAGILSNIKCTLSGGEAGLRKLPLMCALPCFVLGPLKILSRGPCYSFMAYSCGFK